jgi:hypothetical protein
MMSVREIPIDKASAKIKKLEDEVSGLKVEKYNLLSLVKSQSLELATTKQKLDEAVKVIEFYADSSNWCGNKPYLWTTIDQSDTERAIMDEDFDVPVSPKIGGKRARQFLKSIELQK